MNIKYFDFSNDFWPYETDKVVKNQENRKILNKTGLYQICKYFLANLQIAKLHFANLHFTHPSFYQTFFVQTYNLPNTFCQTYIF